MLGVFLLRFPFAPACPSGLGGACKARQISQTMPAPAAKKLRLAGYEDWTVDATGDTSPGPRGLRVSQAGGGAWEERMTEQKQLDPTWRPTGIGV